MFKKASKVFILTGVMAIAIPSMSAMAQEKQTGGNNFCRNVGIGGAFLFGNMNIPYSNYIGAGFGFVQDKWCIYLESRPASPSKVPSRDPIYPRNDYDLYQNMSLYETNNEL